jgi:L-alanine-DL-glutamate epimerase-like enolase superfamily enzyme
LKIESVDLFYLSMPEVLDIGDGSQDALLVRLRAGGLTGWGECEASPLVSIANWCCPMSHSACKNVRDAMLGRTLDSPADIAAIGRHVREIGLDIAQTDHTYSGIDVAMWDLLGKNLGQPVWKLLGFNKALPKTPYASQLFGDSPAETHDKAHRSREQGFRAVKFGWGPYGHGSVEADRDHVDAARRGLGSEGVLLIDAGTVWIDDVARARQNIKHLNDCNVLWLEEPFVGGALDAYHQLASVSGNVKLAGGEGAHNFYMAKQMIDHGGVGFIQIDAGRIGGISVAHRVAQYAQTRRVQYVNHTFTTQLMLSASLQPFAGDSSSWIAELPVEPKPLAADLTTAKLPLRDGLVTAPDSPGLGLDINLNTGRKYLVDTEIRVGGKILYQTPIV